jgi:hypothetical protein
MDKIQFLDNLSKYVYNTNLWKFKEDFCPDEYMSYIKEKFKIFRIDFPSWFMGLDKEDKEKLVKLLDEM